MLRASVYRSSNIKNSKHSNLPRFCNHPSFTVVASDVKDTLAAAMTDVLVSRGHARLRTYCY